MSRARSRAQPPRPPSPTELRILAAYAAADVAGSPGPAALAASLGVKRQIVEGLVRHLVARGDLVELRGGWIVGRGAALAAAARLRESGRETFSLDQARETLGLSRKLLLPLLEWLDEQGLTRREGEGRRLLAPAES